MWGMRQQKTDGEDLGVCLWEAWKGDVVNFVHSLELDLSFLSCKSIDRPIIHFFFWLLDKLA